jgi:hypothetical protein
VVADPKNVINKKENRNVYFTKKWSKLGIDLGVYLPTSKFPGTNSIWSAMA